MSDSFDEPRSKLVSGMLWLVGVHTGAVALHGAAHVAVPVPVASPLDGALILGAFYVGPLVGALLLKARPAIAPVVLAASFLVGVAYGAASHFALAGPDNIGSIPPGAWGTTFMITAVALPPLEGVGLAIAVALFRIRARPRASAARAA